MSDSIKFEKGKYGTKAIIKTLWKDSYLKKLLNKNIKELELNDGKGWSGENINFLKSIPDLKSITIIDFKIKSVEAVHYLNELEKIELYTYCNIPINFNLFPKLIECGFEWIKGSDSIFERSSIQKLFINKYNGTNSDVFSQLLNLEELSILNSPFENLAGLSALKKLRVLRLANLKKIKSLNGLEKLKELEELEIQRCKGISEISDVLKLKRLKSLFINDLGELATIKGIENLTELKAFLFYESTNVIDGDLSSILKLKNLEKISFRNRKHYSHKREDFENMYL